MYPEIMGAYDKASSTETNNRPPRIFGFLLGATSSGAGLYYYVIDEYKVSNELLTEDIYVRPDHFLPFPKSGLCKAH